MTRTKVLLIALGMIALGAEQLAHFYGTAGRAGGIGTASGMIALMTGAAMGIYGIALGRRK
ncbi:MAG: hypothetical protein H7X80_07570 [bacterium]|nr:hypothetical protein [Candidatus Kapabacteria bacterium]